MKKIALILAGGKGTRLWPLSRENYPKQFVEFKDVFSLLQLTIKRLLSSFSAQNLVIISQETYKFTVYNQLELLPGLRSEQKAAIKKNIIFEPVPKNTLPAILLALKFAEETMKLGDTDIVYVFPSDHVIEPVSLFTKCMRSGGSLAEKGKIVVFGIKPWCPKEGYGYILLKKRFGKGYLVDRFVEKPTQEKAKALLTKGAFWNAGIFCFNKRSFLDDVKAFVPEMFKYYELKYAELFERFHNIPANSIDYGIMQKTKKAALVKFEPRWTDLGSWDSFLQFYDEGKGNLKIGSGEFIESQGCFSYSKNRLVCMVGLKDVVAIDSSDALLLVKRGDSDKVKDLVAHINAKGLQHSKDGATVYRPWGYYTILHESKGYKVKEIGIYPKKSLSLQKHQYRSEHWNVVEGSMNVFLGGREINLLKNESVFVPKNIRHKIYNPTNKISKIIEVQIGGYLGEDDIVRFDKY